MAPASRSPTFDADAAKPSSTVPGVVSAIPVVDGQVLLTDDRGGNTGGYVRGIRPADLQIPPRRQRPYPRRLARCVPAARTRSRSAITLANRFGLQRRQPDHPRLPAGRRDRVRHRPPGPRLHRERTIFQVGMNEYDSGYVFLPLESAQIYLSAARTRRPRSRSRPTTPTTPARSGVQILARRCPTPPSASSTGSRPTTASSPPSRSSRT